MATRAYDYTKAHQMMYRVFKVDGIRTMYNGLLPSMIGVLVYKGFGFYMFENLRSLQKVINMPKYLDSFFAAGAAGFIGQLISYPADVVKRKYMVMGLKDKM